MENNKINVSGSNGNNDIFITTSQNSENITVDTNRNSISINATNNNALHYSNKAKEWAEKSEESAKESKESADKAESALNQILNNEDLKKVSANEENINKVANDIENVNFVGENIEGIVGLVESLENLGDTTNINIVASNVNGINTVANDIENVNTVANNKENIKTVVENTSNIQYVAENIEDIKTVEENKNIVLSQVAIAVEKANTSTEQAEISTNQANISIAQATISTTQATKSENNANLSYQYSQNAKDKADICIENASICEEQALISRNQAEIANHNARNSKLYYDNIQQISKEIEDASNQIANVCDEVIENANIVTEKTDIAIEKSNNAKIWAEGTDSEVQALGGVHSSKGWAEIGGSGGEVDLTGYIKNTDYATSSKHGIIKVDLATGISTDSTGKAYISKATDSLVTAKTNNYRPLTPSNIDLVVKTGITTNTIELTDEEKASAKDWLGIFGGSGNGFNLFDTKLSDHILEGDEAKGWALQGTYVYKEPVAGSRDGYPDFYNKVIEEYNEAILTETVNGVTVKVNSNGHKFYDIADKTIIDELFNNTGLAWFYGIDTENERVFLPRNAWFEQMTADTLEVGDSVEAGLPNITGLLKIAINEYSVSGAFTASAGGGKDSANGDDSQSTNFNFDASLSNLIYGNSDTVQPNAVKKLLYICVGNTNVETAVTEVVDVTTTENDTVPLFTGMYFDFKPNNLSWLKAGEQVNSGGLYTTAYNELVNCLNGVNKYNLKVINIADMLADVDYSEYWKVNQVELYFICPTKLSYGAYKDVAPVVGNGYALEFINSDGATVYAMGRTGSSNYYGGFTSVSTTTPQVLTNSNTETTSMVAGYLGVTPDETKSGIEAHLKQSTSELYFKVANAVQNLELINVGEVMENLTNKCDVDLANCTKPYIIEVSDKSLLPSWYRVYSDGWCEQGGVQASSTTGAVTISFLKPYIDLNYIILKNYGSSGTTNMSERAVSFYSKTETSATTYNMMAGANWYSCGYIA